MQQLVLGDLLADSLRFLRRQFVPIALIVVPIDLFVRFAAIALGVLFSVEAGKGAFALLTVATYPIIDVAVIFFIASITVRDKLATTTCWIFGLRFWLPFLLLSLFISAVVALGLVLFIVPGLIVLPRLVFAKFYLLFDKQNPVESMKQSWRVAKDYWGTILSGYLAILVVLIALSFIAASFPGVIRLVLEPLVGVVETLFLIFSFRVYSLVSGSAKEPEQPAI